MTQMREARVTLRPRSPFLSPLQSDTLWGHLAWALAYTEGDAALDHFLARYGDAQAGEPPLVISTAFPAGTLPSPLLAALSRDESESLAQAYYGEARPAALRKLAAALKAIGRVAHLDAGAWVSLAQELSAANLVRRFFRLELCPCLGVPPGCVDCAATFKDCPVFHEAECSHVERWLRRWLREQGPDVPTPVCLVHSHLVTKNTINRLTDTTVAGAGSLHLQEETIYTGLLDVWLLLAEDWAADLDRVRALFETVGLGGFGSGASVGKGRFDVERVALAALDEGEHLPRADRANGFMTLGAYVPRAGEPTEGWYRLRVKRGKLGGTFAAALPVWKRPLFMMEPGSVFRTTVPRHWYGRLVKEVSPFEDDVVQCGMVPVVTAKVLEGFK